MLGWCINLDSTTYSKCILVLHINHLACIAHLYESLWFVSCPPRFVVSVNPVYDRQLCFLMRDHLVQGGDLSLTMFRGFEISSVQ
jgi:hypothetical protein